MFRRITLLVLVLGLSLSVAVTPAAARTETFHFRFGGQFAEATFNTFDETGCIETFAYVAAQDGKVKVDGSPEVESMAIIFVTQFDHCAGEVLLGALGEPTLQPDEFVIDKQLNQATLTTSVVVKDIFTEGLIYSVDVNITWTGVGETSTTKDHVQIKEPGFKLNSRFMGTFRQAQASGTVTALGINFTPEPAVFAQMGDVKQGEVAIFHE